MNWGTRAWRLRSWLAYGIAVQNTAMIDRFFGRTARPLEYIPPGVDLDQFRTGPPDLELRRSWGFPEGAVIIAHVGISCRSRTTST